jgi:hypothetical protein
MGQLFFLFQFGGWRDQEDDVIPRDVTDDFNKTQWRILALRLMPDN